MIQQVQQKILEINRVFYSSFGDAFAATRRRIQPGVRKVLDSIPAQDAQDWLDLGCGSGALGVIWAEESRKGSYTGVDFSQPLLREAREVTAGLSNESLKITYEFADLMQEDWSENFCSMEYDGILAFASLHHIPGIENHRRLFSQVRELLRPDGTFILSVWQFQNSPKLLKRVQPWTIAGLDEMDVDSGDFLLDWRYTLDNSERHGLRYVHLFSEDDLTHLADETGFVIDGTPFYSDGAEGNLALYMKFRRS